MQNTLKHKYMSRWDMVLNMKIDEGKWEKTFHYVLLGLQFNENPILDSLNEKIVFKYTT